MSNIIGVILAGGLSRRMGGGDKTLLPLAGQPMLAHVINRIQPQIKDLIINANGDPARFAAFGLPVIPDSIPDFAGPLAGILAGMEWAIQNKANASYLLSVAGDTPFLPSDLVQRLKAAILAGNEMALAASLGRTHPVTGLWPVRLCRELRQAITKEGLRKIDLFTARYNTAIVEFSADPIDPFFNANTKEELAEAERLVQKCG